MPSYQPTAFLTLKTPQRNYAMDFAVDATTYYSKIALDTEVAYILLRPSPWRLSHLDLHKRADIFADDIFTHKLPHLIRG